MLDEDGQELYLRAGQIARARPLMNDEIVLLYAEDVRGRELDSNAKENGVFMEELCEPEFDLIIAEVLLPDRDYCVIYVGGGSVGVKRKGPGRWIVDYMCIAFECREL